MHVPHPCVATTTTTAKYVEPTTLPPSEMLYGNTGTYYWPQFNNNITAATIMGGWRASSGVVQGPFGFGKAIGLGAMQVINP